MRRHTLLANRPAALDAGRDWRLKPPPSLMKGMALFWNVKRG